MENTVLEAIYRSSRVSDADGVVRDVNSQINQRQGLALYRTVREARPEHVVEIGLAMGLSALPILTALQENRRGHLHSLDPNQHTDWHDLGLTHVARAGLEARFTHYGDPDFLGLPDLLRNLGRSVGFAFIDGWHTFDHVLLDFFYIDKMLVPGGIVAFDDTGMPATRRVLRYVTSHRHYAEIDVGLPATYKASNRVKTAIRRVARWNTQNRYFRKLDEWEPEWNFYSRF